MSDSFISLAIQLTRIIIPILIVVGTVGNSINIFVLTRPALYNYACSRYFLALGIINLYYSTVQLSNSLLTDGYQLDVEKISPVSCKITLYIGTLCAMISPYFIVLASIDRYCASSTNTQRRKFSDIRVTRWAILFVIALLALYTVNSLVLADLRFDDYLGCTIRGDTIYKQVYTISQVIVFVIIAPGLMGFFGIMTIYNTKQLRVLPATTNRHRRTENQLARMLLLQVGTYIVLNLPLSTSYLIGILPNSLKITSQFFLAYKISFLCFHTSFTTAFILYFLSAGLYRKECLRLMYKILRKEPDTRIHPSQSQVTALPMVSMTHTRRAQHEIVQDIIDE